MLKQFDGDGNDDDNHYYHPPRVGFADWISWKISSDFFKLDGYCYDFMLLTRYKCSPIIGCFVRFYGPQKSENTFLWLNYYKQHILS